MNYKFETLMSWIKYYQSGIWDVVQRDDCVNDSESIRSKFQDIFKNELAREYNECAHLMLGVYSQFGPLTVFVNTQEHKFKVIDNYNILLSIYNGIYGVFDGKILCLNTKHHGYNGRYFEYKDKEDDDYVSIYSIVTGECKNTSPNVRRMISILFSRPFRYIENVNPEDFMFMDYSEEEKESTIKDIKNNLELTKRGRRINIDL